MQCSHSFTLLQVHQSIKVLPNRTALHYEIYVYNLYCPVIHSSLVQKSRSSEKKGYLDFSISAIWEKPWAIMKSNTFSETWLFSKLRCITLFQIPHGASHKFSLPDNAKDTGCS
jgi:hypothetical protein